MDARSPGSVILREPGHWALHGSALTLAPRLRRRVGLGGTRQSLPSTSCDKAHRFGKDWEARVGQLASRGSDPPGCRPTRDGLSEPGVHSTMHAQTCDVLTHLMIRTLYRFLAALAWIYATSLCAQGPDRIVFATDWFAQAEHGGFYQALAQGTYRKHNLDVQIRMGGPQVNGLQLLAAGQLDMVMGDALQVLSAVEQGVPVVAIAATFQKNPTVIIAHPGVARLEELKGRPIAIGAASNTTFWPWLKQRYGFTDAQKRPYGFSVQPFLADAKLSQQGFATSEPFSIEKAGVNPVVFLLADLGYPPYSEALIVTRDTLARRADALARFVRASAEGWKSYLADPSPGNALIRKDNPQMSEELLAYGWRKLKEHAIVDGEDARTQGLLTMTAVRWTRTIDFLNAAGLAKPNVDYATAYSLDIVRNVRVLP
jgi:NitT/TauT family transport system substrate-binding protein